MRQRSPAREHHPRWRQFLVPGGCILGLSALALLFWVVVPPLLSSGISANRVALVSALGAARPLEGRVTGGFDYLPLERRVYTFAGSSYTAEYPPQLQPPQARLAAPLVRRIELDYQRNPTPQKLGDKALLILLGQKDHETAITILQEAVKTDPHNAMLWSDLAAAYLASTRPGPSRFLALEAAHRAVTESPSLPEARFNLALALEQCLLLRQAARAWEAYLRLDSHSGWAEEARKHLRYLPPPHLYELWHRVCKKLIQADLPVTSLPYRLDQGGIYQKAREDAMENILGRWGSLLSKGRPVETVRELEMARKIGNILPSDRTLSDAIKLIDATTTERQTSLARAHEAYQHGMKQFRTGKMDLAQPWFEISAELFSRTGSPFEHWAHAALAEIAHYRSDFLNTERLLAKIRSDAHLTRYPALNRRLFWIEGLGHLSKLEPSRAEKAFRSASWGHHDEEEFAGIIDFYSSRSLEEASEPNLSDIHRALYNLSRHPESKHLVDLLRNLANTFSEKHPEVAIYLFREGLEVANNLQDPSPIIELLIDRSRFWSHIGEKDKARRDLAAVERKWPSLAGHIFRRRLEFKKEVARCRTLDDRMPAQCVQVLTNAIAYYLEHDQTLLSDAYQIRADVYHLLARIEAEEEDLAKAIELYEKGIISSGILRSRRLEQTRALYESMSASKLSNGDHKTALELIDRSRSPISTHIARTYDHPSYKYMLASRGCNRPYSQMEFEHQLPKRTTLIEYKVQGDNIVAWVFRNKSVRRIKLGVTSRQILKHITPTPDPLSGRLRVNVASPELTQWLLQPLLPWLPEDGDLVLLTDPVLEKVWFAALKHPRTGQSLGGPYRLVCHLSRGERFSLDGDIQKALKLLQMSLAHSITETRNTPARRRLHTPINSILNKFPDSTALIEYFVSKDALLIWTAHKGKLSFHSTPINSDELNTTIDRWLATMNNLPAPQAENLSFMLYRSLIEPIINNLPGSGDLVIVPDTYLNKVPFAALADPRSGKYMIERYSVSTTTSATLYLQQLARFSHPNHRNWTAYVVNNPVSIKRPVQRASLPGAASETETILRLFPGSEMVTGIYANRELSFWPDQRHSIVHFAGHWDPPNRAYDGTIEADSLPIVDNVKLVVLSACHTVSNRWGHRENGFGIAGSLLDRWVPAVVASYWDIDDRATNHLLRQFYAYLRAGQDAANALRSAQLELLHGEDLALRHPSKWASFQLLGFGGI